MNSKDRRNGRGSRERSPLDERRRRRSRSREDRRRERSHERMKIRVKEEPRSPDRNPPDRRPNGRREERGPPPRRNDDRHDRPPPHRRPPPKSGGDDEGRGKFEWGKKEDTIKKEPEEDAKPRETPNFGLSGALAKDTNSFNGVVVKYNEPPEARKPKLRWRLYPFKGDEALDFIPVHRQSAYMLGRDRRVADIPVDHPSCSKQHAVLQFRLIKRTLDDGSVSRRVRPYVIDLGSANGTSVNNQRIDSERYVELFEKDILKFGFSSRDYVLLHENSQEEIEADDGTNEEPTETTTGGGEKQGT